MIPRSPLSAFAGERLAGIGHNQGPPLDSGWSFRRFAWKKARAQLMPRLPLEVVRRRVARARALGLEYPQYASILMGTGRDIVGFLFTCEALGLRLRKSAEIPDKTTKKLSDISGAQRIVLTGENPVALARALAASPGLPVFAHVAKAPGPASGYGAARDAIQAALRPLNLPADTVVMIGTDPRERDWADAARLAKFLPAEQYFPR